MPTLASPPPRCEPPLAELIDLSAQGLMQVVQGQSAREVVASWPATASRPGAQALLYTALRHWGQAQGLIALLARRAPSRAVQARLGVALALLLAPQEAAYAPHTVVNQTVQAMRGQRALAAQAGFVNACLRRFLRERAQLEAALQGDEQARWNHPAWWVRQLRQDHPAHWQAVLQANQQRAPLTLRVNESLLSRQEYAQQLQQAGIQARAVAQAGLELAQAVDVRQLPGFDQGWFSVQDAAAQRAAPMLLEGFAPPASAATPWLVLDACAAPGGKTAHLLEWAAVRGVPMQLLAMDVDAARCQRITQNLQRLQLPQAQVVVADASAPQRWRQSLLGDRLLDLLLLDAPCSASGIVRRHADIRWLRRAEDLTELAQRQALLLQRLWPLLRPGGRLLYCTCSVFHCEGQGQIERFMRAQADTELLAPMLQLLPTAPKEQGQAPGQGPDAQGSHDGFFYALLHKRAAQ
ncbi:16S rRNA (cytosine(967)-C(5))-methyltransferase RsmB [Vandammella animalimorsus]|uniref:16S rRNA (cytosine(967)-C(5))-methyltransferase RsmB n=1 Tax=Vandammella animalimorsus TaxID=2029117 RepID=UPI00325A6CA8